MNRQNIGTRDGRELTQKEIASSILFTLSKEQEVTEIYISKESGSRYHLWIVIPEKTEEIQKKIFQHERLLTQQYATEDIFIDFHIIEVPDTEYLKHKEARLLFLRR